MKSPAHAISRAPETVPILSVSPYEGDHLALESILNDSAWEPDASSQRQVSRAATLSTALTALRRVQYSVVLCERDLPLGDWRDLLEHSRRLARPPLLIVTSLHADERLWAEALNRGAHDVLAKPFHALEVTRVVTLAYLRWYRDWQHATPNTGSRQAVSAA